MRAFFVLMSGMCLLAASQSGAEGNSVLTVRGTTVNAQVNDHTLTILTGKVVVASPDIPLNVADAMLSMGVQIWTDRSSLVVLKPCAHALAILDPGRAPNGMLPNSLQQNFVPSSPMALAFKCED